jgi:DNA gyrase/topoisomerase IV subunit A
MGMTFFQAEEIVDTRLAFLAKLSKFNLQEQLNSVTSEIATWEEFCTDPKAVTSEIVKSAHEDLKPYFRERKTSIAETDII